MFSHHADHALSTASPPTRRLAVTLTVAVAAWMALVLKSPGALGTPQLWAEDGEVFFLQQWNHDAPQLFVPYAGYLHSVPRLVAWIAGFFHPGHAPLVFNFAAITVAALALAYCARKIDPVVLGIVFVAGFLATPTNGEVFGTITNSQWFTQAALIAACFLPASPHAVGMRVLAVLAVLIVALNGPFSTLLIGAHALALLASLPARRIPALSWLPGSLARLDRWRLVALWLGGLTQLLVYARADLSAGDPLSVAYIFDAIAGMTQTHTFGVRLLHPALFLAVLVALVLAPLHSSVQPRVRLFLWMAWALALAQIAVATSKPEMVVDVLRYGDRYFVLFKATFWASLFVALTWIPRIGHRRAFVLTAVLIAAVGTLQRDHLRRSRLPDLGWPQHVSRLAADSATEIGIHPQPWKVVLPPQPAPLRHTQADRLPALLQSALRALPGQRHLPDPNWTQPFLPSAYVDRDSAPLRLEPQATATFGWSAPLSGRVTAVSLFIGTYGGQANGELIAELCSNEECRQSSTDLARSPDNHFVRLELPRPLPVDASAPLTLRVATRDATHPVAFWSYPATADSAAIEAMGGYKHDATAHRTIRIGLSYHD